MTPEDVTDLRVAKGLLENASLTARIAGALGKPIEIGLARLPENARKAVAAATRRSLETALAFALTTMDDRHRAAANWAHKVVAAATGAAGGAFGIAALAVELPLSTVIMLRSIADVARSEGERIKLPDAQLACLAVFALGGRAQGDDASETGYFATRAALARAIADATEYIARRGAAREAAPPLVRLIGQLASRFGIPVSEKAVAQSLPVVGAAGGALINTLFVDHFQDIARGHFIVRRLERTYGPEPVQRAYRHA